MKRSQTKEGCLPCGRRMPVANPACVSNTVTNANKVRSLPVTQVSAGSSPVVTATLNVERSLTVEPQLVKLIRVGSTPIAQPTSNPTP